MKTVKDPTTGLEVNICPNQCSHEEIELGKDQSSFMAMLGKPYMYLRCGKCGFNERETMDDLSLNLAEAIEKWNKNTVNQERVR